MGVSLIVDSIAGKMGFVSEKKCYKSYGVSNYSSGRTQPAKSILRLKMVNALYAALLQSFCVKVLQTLLSRTLRRAEILLVPVH